MCGIKTSHWSNFLMTILPSRLEAGLKLILAIVVIIVIYHLSH